jgi:16S rRNA (cytosine967-C5)-methyltransferase
MTTSRHVALEALNRIEHDGAYANLVLPGLLAASRLDERDRAFTTELVYGTTRMRRALDFAVDRFVKRPPPPELRTILRLGAYQLLYARVPDHAAVSATVGLAGPGARGFVNAVLRRVAVTPPVAWPDDATRLSYPDWLAARLVTELGRMDALAAMERMNLAPPVSTRADGYVQDQASQWVAELVGAEAGERVADLCAAPGGKATALAHTSGYVVAVDRHPVRAGMVVANAARVGVAGSLGALVADASRAPFVDGCFDRVLLDAPCSGLGALRRRPDARWRISSGDVDALAGEQAALLASARRLVRPGGLVVYSVCTFTAAESTALDDGSWPALDPPPAPWRPYGRGARLLPQDADTDGMIVLRYRRPL